MKTVSVTSHFGSNHIQLGELLELEPNTKFIVVVSSEQDAEREEWLPSLMGQILCRFRREEPQHP